MRSISTPASSSPGRRCEPPRVSRRLQLLRGWSYDEAIQPRIPPRSVPARFGWSWTTKASTSRNGRRSSRLPRRSAARAKHCVTGCGRPSLTRACGPVERHERERIKALERENRELRQANEIPGFRGAGSAEGICLFCPGEAPPPVQTMIAFIDEHRARHGVEPICRVLPIAPSTYHAHAARRADPGSCPHGPSAISP